LDFFEEQERRRRTSRWLVLWYAGAAALTVASYAAAGALLHVLANVYWSGAAGAPWQVAGIVAGIVGACILGVSALRLWQFNEGGHVVAELLGACALDPGACTATERRLLNVVEEMAIASGLAVPPVYVMRREDAVNALVAGYSPNEAVMVVTRGAVERLSRDELQGVMGHEFSHILNGDMALNLRAAALLSGLTWIGEQGERMAFQAAGIRSEKDDAPILARGGAHSSRTGTGNPIAVLVGAALAFTGFPGTLAASALRAALSREREFLADAASVQFTRNAEAIAGALDSILALSAHTAVLAAGAERLAHMFFAPAVGHWYTFPTHPPIARRIARVHPRFQRDDYRATRHGRRLEVAVLDGSGNVIKHLRPQAREVLASVGHPTSSHVDFGRRLLQSLPGALREALASAAGAEKILFALGGFADRAGSLQAQVQRLARQHVLTLAELALPAVRSQPQAARDRFLAEFAALVEADRRVTRREFVLLTFLGQRLRAGAGEPIPARYRKVAEVAEDARVVISLLAAASSAAPEKAFANGAAVLDLGWQAPAAPRALTSAGVAAALERLRQLAPLAKPALLGACVAAASADGSFNLAEAELLRTIAATLDCPVPPILAAQDPLALAA
jgi:Zn-dependent protease with chaperone function